MLMMSTIASKPTSFILRFLSATLPPVLWAALIFVLSAQPALPGLTVSSLDFIFKKTAHMVVYAVLYLLLYRATWILTQHSALKVKHLLTWPLLLCLFYAVTDEIHQSFTPNRSPAVRDIGYDMLGTLIAFLKVHQYI